MKLKLTALILSLALIFSLAVSAGADFGDYAGDYDYDYGDSYDYDYDYGDSYDYDYDYDDDYDYGYDDYGGFFYFGDYGSGGSGGSGFDASALIGLIIIALVVIAVVRSRRAKKNNSGMKNTVFPNTAQGKNTPPNITPQARLRNMTEYLSLDPGFSEHEMCEKIGNLYVRFQNAWQNKDMDTIRACLNGTLFAQCSRQLDGYRRAGQTNVVENIAVLNVSLSGWYSEGGNDYIAARLSTRINDYVIDDATGNVVKGNPKAEKFMTYEWTLCRTSGRKTAKQSGISAQNCPNCGAPININHSAKCEYCDSVLTDSSFDWVVSGIKGISQHTVG